MCKGSYFPKSLHKFLLPENVFIFYFCDVEMPLRCLKVEFRGQKPQKFNIKSNIKSWKVLQTSQFLVKNCVLISSCSLFTKNINLGFYFTINTDFMPKNSHFFSFSLFSGLFSLRGEVEIFFWGKNLLNDVSKTILNAKIISIRYLKYFFLWFNQF